MKIALLTGASSGLGCAYAKYIGEIFPEIDEIWALARRADRLNALAGEISKPRIVPMACDLSNPADMAALKAKLQQAQPEIMLLVALDEPADDTGMYPSGGAMAAPAASAIMAEILPYLGIEPTYSAEELLGADTTLPNVTGLSVSEAIARVQEKGFNYKLVGEGDTVTDQRQLNSGKIAAGVKIIQLCRRGIDGYTGQHQCHTKKQHQHTFEKAMLFHNGFLPIIFLGTLYYTI